MKYQLNADGPFTSGYFRWARISDTTGFDGSHTRAESRRPEIAASPCRSRRTSGLWARAQRTTAVESNGP